MHPPHHAPDFLEHSINVILRFWGARPTDGGVPEEPYHNLRLDDPIREPAWIERFEAWMRVRGSSGQTRNHYRSTVRGMYRTALLPAYRGTSGITVNPFRDVARDSVSGRTVTISVEDLRKWLAAASYHVRLAVAIAALAPKLRLASVLALTWAEHIDAEFHYISVRRHKTATKVKRPQVVPISEQLRTILHDARLRTHNYVVEYRQRPIKSIRGGLQEAANRAGIAYGRAGDGVTFHTLRHTAASLLAELGESEAIARRSWAIVTSRRPSGIRTFALFTRSRRMSDSLPLCQLRTSSRIRDGARAISLSGKVSGLFPTQIDKLQQKRGQFDKL